MKKYIGLIPGMLYPYAYMLFIVFIGIFILTSYAIYGEEMTDKLIDIVFVGVITGYHILVIIATIYSAVMITGKKYTAYEAAETNMLMKCIHIPAYVLHFIIGFVGALMGVFGLGFLLFAIIMDILTIAVSGIYSCGCMVKLRKKKVLTTGKAILAGIGSFIYCVDVGLAIYLFLQCRKQKGENDMEVFRFIL